MSQRVTPPQRDEIGEILDEVLMRSLESKHAREEAALESILEELGIPQQERDIYYERLKTFREAFSRGDIDTFSEIADDPVLCRACAFGADADRRATDRSILRRVLDERGVSEENRSVYFERLRTREDRLDQVLKR